MKHSERCLEAHQGIGRNEGFTCTDNCNITKAKPVSKSEHIPMFKSALANVIANHTDEYIIRSVNAHEEMLTLLKRFQNYLYTGIQWDRYYVEMEESNKLIYELDEVIFKAEGK